MKKTEIILITFGVLALLFAGSIVFLNFQKNSSAITTTTTSTIPSGNDLFVPRENSENNVEISMTYLNPTETYKDVLAFDVRFTTHTGSLDYQFDKISYLRDSKGNLYRAISWEGGSGGHHISGILKFPKFDSSGNPIVKDNEGNFEIIMEGIYDVKERVFKW